MKNKGLYINLRSNILINDTAPFVLGEKSKPWHERGSKIHISSATTNLYH